jgi:transposase
MRNKIKLRPLTEEERETVEKLIKSQTASAIEVERAKTIWLAQAGERIPVISQKQERTQATIYRRIKRFNELGLKSLTDEARPGRPTTYTEEERGQMIAAARTHPQKAGRPYSHWTLSRLVEYVNRELGIPISRAQLARILEEEGLRWYQEQTYFTERPDPQFVEKRGPS